MERVKGIEPSYSAWEAAALPLSYTRMMDQVIAITDVVNPNIPRVDLSRAVAAAVRHHRRHLC